jgi:CO/xanthine dehydrogenase FAD-binding subunit
MTATLSYRAPVQREDLLNLLGDYGETAKILAGGTDLLVNLRGGFATPSMVVNVKNVAGFSDLTWSADGGLVIRPGTTINDILESPKVRSSYPLLVACARDLASHQIRNRATVIGNVANASPCADMAPALLCLRAHAVISSTSGSRIVPFSEFFTGVKRTVMRADEFLEEIVVPAETADARGYYTKLKRIKGHDLGIVGVAALNQGGDLRLGISSCAPTPILVDGLSARDPVESVVDAVLGAISPISDVRCSREYRMHMVGVFVRRALEEVA